MKKWFIESADIICHCSYGAYGISGDCRCRAAGTLWYSCHRHFINPGIPDFGAVLHSVIDEMVVESYIVADEMADKSQDTYGTVIEALPQVPFRCIAHEEFKEMAAKAKAVIRTGETTPYANIILVAGVNF